MDRVGRRLCIPKPWVESGYSCIVSDGFLILTVDIYHRILSLVFYGVVVCCMNPRKALSVIRDVYVVAYSSAPLGFVRYPSGFSLSILVITSGEGIVNFSILFRGFITLCRSINNYVYIAGYDSR